MKSIIYYLFKIFFGKNFANKNFSVRILFKHIILQKIFRINSNVSWPVHWSTQVKFPQNIKKGSRCPGMSMGCYLDGRNGINIGDNVWIGPKVSIISMNHDINNYDKYIENTPIIIGENCWIATGVTILSGVTLGPHTIVAAGSVITKSFPQGNQMLGGVPAKVIKKIGQYSEK
tara:strand:- start:200 stop:721 length:522 start_codon:yes stop_codon:yes gene_type:complete